MDRVLSIGLLGILAIIAVVQLRTIVGTNTPDDLGKPSPMVEWLMQRAPHLTQSQAEKLWLAISKIVPDAHYEGVNWRMLMLSLAWQESRWDFTAVGDDGQSKGLFQLTKDALSDVRTFYNQSFVVSENLLFDPEYSTTAAWGYLQVNMRAGRADGDLELAVTMHNVGPTRKDLAESRRYWGRQIIEQAMAWQKEVPRWNPVI